MSDGKKTARQQLHAEIEHWLHLDDVIFTYPENNQDNPTLDLLRKNRWQVEGRISQLLMDVMIEDAEKIGKKLVEKIIREGFPGGY